MLRTFKCIVPDITCGSCIEIIGNVLSAQDSNINVTHVSGNEITKIIHIDIENDERSVTEIFSQCKALVDDIGMTVEAFEEVFPTKADIAKTNTTDIVTVLIDDDLEPYQDGEVTQTVTLTADKKRITKRKKTNSLFFKILKASIGILAGAAIIGVMLSGVVIPPIGMYIMVGVSSLLTLILGFESYRATYYNLKNLKKEKKLTMDVLYTLSSLVIVGSMIAGLFYSFMPMMMEAGLWIFGFKYAGKVLEAFLNSKTIDKTSVEELAAKTVWRKKMESEEWEENVDAGDIEVGDIIKVAHGEKVPVNGILLSPSAWLRDKALGGSVETKHFVKGADIYAGTKIPKDNNKLHYVNDDIIIQVTHKRENSYYYAIENASVLNQPKKSELETKAAKYLKVFVPAVIVASIISGVLIGVFISPPLGIRFAVSVLATFCPCVIGTSLPTSMWLGVKKGVNNGVIFKDSAALESGSDIDKVVFDLNRTLTLGKLRITEALLYDVKDTSADYFGIVAAIQKHGKHQFARIIANDAERKSSGKKNYEVRAIDDSQNTGIKATINDDEYLIGNIAFLKFHQVDIEHEIQVNGAEQITYIVKNKRVIGHYKIKDPLRPDAKYIVQELQRAGKEVHICTGADIEVAKRYAAELGIDEKNIYANSVGSAIVGNDRTKEKYIQLLKSQNKRVAMVGDGENDAVAMSASHFSIAVKSGDKKSLVCNNARATIRDDNLLPILTSFTIAEQSVRSAKASLFISLTYNLTTALVLGGLMIGIGFALNPAIGIALMIAQASIILIIQYAIYKKKMAHVEQYKKAAKHFEQDDSSYDLMMRHGVGRPDLQQGSSPHTGFGHSNDSKEQPLLSQQNVDLTSETGSQFSPPLVFASSPGNSFN